MSTIPGIVITDFGTGSDIASGLTVQANGKILVAGTDDTIGDFALARYNPDGTLDTTFSSDGLLTTDLSSGGWDGSSSVAVQADGKILVLGTSTTDFALVRYNPNGSLDATFGGDGLVTTDFGNSNDYGTSVAVQADGKILAVGHSLGNNSIVGFALARYNPNGTLDTTFSSDGMLTTDFGNSGAVLSSVVVQTDGKILVAGSSSNGNGEDFALARYNPNGTLDTTFSSDGMLTTDFGGIGEEAWSVAVQADGKILAAGHGGDSHSGGNFGFALARYNPDGTLDTTFSSDGLLTTSFGGPSYYGRSVAVQADGKILVAGMDGNIGDFALARYNPDGTLDTTFSSDGLLTTDSGGIDDGVSVKVQADGKILVAGTSRVNDGSNFALVRYNPNGTLDTSFGSNNHAPTGNVTISGTAKQGQTLTASNTLADADGLGTISYQWQADGVAINGATAKTLNLTQAQVGKAISVTASYTDRGGTLESKTSTASSAVLNINDAPTGSVTISGTTTQGQTLTASNTLADADGLGTISYQWKANGVAISGATTSTLDLAQAQVGKLITVTASYTDGGRTVESKTSNATSAIVNINDAPTGDVTISGTVQSGKTLTANSSLADVDRLGALKYQWLADDTAISGATARTFALGESHIGKAISVAVSYTDLGGMLESKTSVATSAVENIDGVLPGSVSISSLDLITAEDGKSAVFSVQLNKAPIDPVTVQFAVSDTTEATLPTTSLTFTSTNWNTAQSLTVVGNDDDLEDGDITYQLKATVVSDDLFYKRVTIKPIELINENDRLDAPIYVYGDGDSNTLQGNRGADYLYGRGGNDNLSGDRGNDWLYGGSGDDTLDGGVGADNMDGGDGSDIYYVDDAKDVVKETNPNLAKGGVDTVISTLSSYALPANIENGAINNNNVASLSGNTLDNILYAAPGDNVLNGISGIDTVSYLYGLVSGATTGVNISLATGVAQTTGGSGKDTLLNIQNITGSSLDDRLTGNNRNNVLDGGAGNDMLVGGLGKDTLLGGVGNDVFDFNAINEMGASNTTWDVIVDFVSGQDKIDLSTLDANALTTSNDAFNGTLIAAADNFTAAGQLKLVVFNGTGVLYGNVDADSEAEFAIQLTGVTTLSATDFVL